MRTVEEEILEHAIANGTGQILTHVCSRVDPLPGQVRIVDEAIARALRFGLRLPPQIEVRWRDRGGRKDVCRGMAGCEHGRYFIVLAVDVWPDELREVAFHELAHIADYFSGQEFTRLESEKRAIAFTARAMGWQ